MTEVDHVFEDKVHRQVFPHMSENIWFFDNFQMIPWGFRMRSGDAKDNSYANFELKCELNLVQVVVQGDGLSDQMKE